jgi:hypothetical protein
MGGRSAVFTVFRNTNYGAVLQSYASTTFLKRLTGEDVFLIDYIRNQNTNLMHNGLIYYGKHGKKSINKKSIKKFARSITNYEGTVARTKTFSSFIENVLPVFPQKFFTDDKIVLDGFDYYFLGSDQIWNPDIMKGFHDAYFGITETKPKKIIAYAPSLGKQSFSKDEQAVLVEKLKNIDALSCREVDSCKFLEELTGKEVRCVVDPTLLLDREDWQQISDTNTKLPDKYVLVYSLRFDRQLMKAAQEKANEIGEKVVLLGTGKGKPDKGIIYKRAFGPAQFITAINKASYVYTDSFHGTVFSILFGKQFVVRANGEKGQRMESLCGLLGLKHRSFREIQELPDIDEIINYDTVYGRLAALREQSIQYLKENIE